MLVGLASDDETDIALIRAENIACVGPLLAPP